MECTICQNEWDSDKHIPRILPCGHSFCESCILLLISKLNNGTKINDVANLLGHRNVETTENYYITSLEDNRKSAVELFDKNNKSNVIENVIKFQIQEGKLV